MSSLGLSNDVKLVSIGQGKKSRHDDDDDDAEKDQDSQQTS